MLAPLLPISINRSPQHKFKSIYPSDNIIYLYFNVIFIDAQNNKILLIVFTVVGTEMVHPYAKN